LKGVCSCALCNTRQKPTGVITPRIERMRGYEIELTRSIDAGMGDCSSHFKFCDKGDGCSLLQPKDRDFCGCESCNAEKKVKEGGARKCPGHSCAERGTSQYLTEIVKNSVEFHEVQGDFSQHRRTPRDNEFWDLKTDSSCGYEIATPPLTGGVVEKVVGPVVKALQAEAELHKIEFVGNACGLHVTFDVQDVGARGIKQVVFTMLRHQAALVGTQAGYRRGNEACPFLQNGKDTRREVATVPNIKRQLPGRINNRGVMNLSKVQHGSDLIEFRYGGASLDIKEIAAFGVLNECLIQASLHRPEICITNNRKRRLFEEIVKPYIGDKRVEEAWEAVLEPRLKESTLGRV